MTGLGGAVVDAADAREAWRADRRAARAHRRVGEGCPASWRGARDLLALASARGPAPAVAVVAGYRLGSWASGDRIAAGGSVGSASWRKGVVVDGPSGPVWCDRPAEVVEAVAAAVKWWMGRPAGEVRPVRLGEVWGRVLRVRRESGGVKVSRARKREDDAGPVVVLEDHHGRTVAVGPAGELGGPGGEPVGPVGLGGVRSGALAAYLARLLDDRKRAYAAALVAALEAGESLDAVPCDGVPHAEGVRARVVRFAGEVSGDAV